VTPVEGDHLCGSNVIETNVKHKRRSLQLVDSETNYRVIMIPVTN
jgi:hypothetical protein